MKQISKAVLAVMEEVKGLEKTLDVGYGNSSYKGVADKAVKESIRPAMIKNGLMVIPKSITPTVHRTTWEADKKLKQAIFTEAQTEYTLVHTSGETLDFAGYGHGADSQDKAAGKATTYALKYALLYLFLIPTGKILDTDNDHSDDLITPLATKPVKKAPPIRKATKKKVVHEDSVPKEAIMKASLALEGVGTMTALTQAKKSCKEEIEAYGEIKQMFMKRYEQIKNLENAKKKVQDAASKG